MHYRIKKINFAKNKHQKETTYEEQRFKKLQTQNKYYMGINITELTDSRDTINKWMERTARYMVIRF